ncbi:MAG: 4-hydroxy-tetrahydrodipicolinate synthase [Alphaproteobacteria bacterium]|nr:4-hydroxy-tetrahydrodipicolinate synthase [Alphaproteobacteria bacterium]
MNIKGSIVALVTPFRNGKVDEKCLQDLVEWHVKEGTNGLVPCGTTGESPTLSHDEHDRVIQLVVEAANKRVPVIAGTGSNSTEETIRLTRHAAKVGADAALVVCPYYNRPTQEGLYQHYRTLSEAVDLPIVIYNIPGRSAVDMSVETMARLAKLPGIVGVKDATSDMARVSRMRVLIGERFVQLSGNDDTALGLMAHGGHGCISVTANVAPRACAQFQRACLAGDFAAALGIQDRLMALHLALFVETSPAPIKFAMSLIGKCEPEVRLPLVQVNDSTRDKVRVAMQAAGLLN